MSSGGRKTTYVLVLGLGVDELLAEVLPVAVVRGVVDDDLLVVVGQLVDDVLVLLAELQIVVGGDALLRDRGSINGRSASDSCARAPRVVLCRG